MALVVQIGITVRRPDGAQFIEPIDELEIRRLEPLVNPGHPAWEVHRYRASTHTPGDPVEFMHRYGEGAAVCVEKALTAIREGRS